MIKTRAEYHAWLDTEEAKNAPKFSFYAENAKFPGSKQAHVFFATPEWYETCLALYLEDIS